MEQFGALMYETHEGLKDLYEVSCSELDVLVDTSKKLGYVAGARLMGGGFGGCTINLVKQSEVDNFSEADFPGIFQVNLRLYRRSSGLKYLMVQSHVLILTIFKSNNSNLPL